MSRFEHFAAFFGILIDWRGCIVDPGTCRRSDMPAAPLHCRKAVRFVILTMTAWRQACGRHPGERGGQGGGTVQGADSTRFI